MNQQLYAISKEDKQYKNMLWKWLLKYKEKKDISGVPTDTETAKKAYEDEDKSSMERGELSCKLRCRFTKIVSYDYSRPCWSPL